MLRIMSGEVDRKMKIYGVMGPFVDNHIYIYTYVDHVMTLSHLVDGLDVTLAVRGCGGCRGVRKQGVADVISPRS